MAKTETAQLSYIWCDRCETPIIQHDPTRPLAGQEAADSHLKKPDHFPFDLSVIPETAPIQLVSSGHRVIVVFMLPQA